MSDDPVGDGEASLASGGADPENRARTPEPSHEEHERVAARRRGEARQQERVVEAPEDHVVTEAPVRVDRRTKRAAERAFAALSENVRDYAILLLDADGIITYWGEGARLMKRWTSAEAVGAHLRMFYLDGGSEDGTAEDHLITAAAHGESVSEGRRVRGDGTMFWADATLTALREADGTLLGFAKVTRDLTTRRAADAALLAATAAQHAAEAVSAAKSEFVATMSHEVRTPINALLGYADLLDLGVEGPLTDGQHVYVERLRTSAHHLLDLVEDVLDLARIDAGALPLEHALGRVGDVVVAALALVEPQARQRGLELVQDLGTQADGLSYWGEAKRVRQILVNLLANAVKFAQSRDGTPGRITVSVGADTEPPTGVELAGTGPWVYIRVEDSGPGIAASQLDTIFEPFAQVDRRSNNPVEGAGLGLTISRRLARRMGGDISVRSTVGVGSAFVVWLQVAPLRTDGRA